jgi:hypothetical protein
MQVPTMVLTSNTDMDDPYTVPSSFTKFIIDASSNDIAIDLTIYNYIGQYYYFYRVDTSSYNVTISPKTGFTLNGGTTSIPLGVNQTCEVVSIVSDWKLFKYNCV